MGDNVLVVQSRAETGKGVARKLRTAGRIPAVLYGRGRATTALSMDPRALERLLQQSEAGMNTLIDLQIEGVKDRRENVVLVKELQRDPLSGSYLHVDLFQVDLTATVEVEIPIHLIGRPVGVELHEGVLDHSLRELEIECLPRAIPEHIEVDVSALDVGDSIHVRDLTLPEGVELRCDPDLSVASVVAAKVIEEAVPEAEAVPTEEGAAEAPAEGEAKPAEGEAEKSADSR